MAKTKTTQKQNQTQTSQHTGTSTQSGSNTNDYGYLDRPIDAQTQGVIDMANEAPGSDPGLHARYARMKDDVQRSTMDPLGAYTTPFVRQRAQLGQMLKISSMEDQAKREDAYNQKQNQFGRKLAAAQLTRADLVNKGGSYTSTGTQSGTSSGTMSGTSTSETGKPWWSTLIDVGVGAAA